MRRHCPERSVVLATDDPIAAERFRGMPQVASVTANNGRLTIHGSGDDLVTEVIRSPVGGAHSRHGLPHRSADARGRVPEGHWPLHSDSMDGWSLDDRVTNEQRLDSDSGSPLESRQSLVVSPESFVICLRFWTGIMLRGS